MNYTPFKTDYKIGSYQEQIRQSQGYKGAEPFHGSYKEKKQPMLSASQISTAYL